MKFLPLLLLAFAVPLRASEPTAQFAVQGDTVTLTAGVFHTAAGEIALRQPAQLAVPPALIFTVEKEPLKLSADKPQGYGKGTKLKGVNARDTNARGALVPSSLELRNAAGEVLEPEKDYLADRDWGMVGVGPSGKVTKDEVVTASYRYAKLRLDTVQVSPAGVATLKLGEPHITTPLPPAPDAGQTAIAHILRGYSTTALTAEDIYPILEAAAQATTATTRGRVPKTLAKLRAGEPLKIVALGDSVTAGGNASSLQSAYPAVFEAGLRQRFPQSKFTFVNLSAGGSNSGQWLYPEKNAYRGLKGDANPARFERVLAEKPDLLTIEFVNDAGLSGSRLTEQYDELLKRLQPLGTEVIFITPHYTMWSMMKFTSMREAEKRPYVLDLRKYAESRHLGLADASARWEHLWKEGLPYLTLLHNTINHPDDRGHLLFAEELWKCFE